MFKYLIIFLKASYTIIPPQKKNVLIYDRGRSEIIIEKIFKIEKLSFLFTRKEEFNLFILMKTFLNFRFKYFDYLIEYIKYVEAKVVVTSADNDRNFYLIKKRLPQTTTIFFQNGFRAGGEGDIFGILENKKKLKIYKKEYFVDLMCVFNKMTADCYNKFISGQTFVSGSIRSNDTKISKSENSLVFIPVFRITRNLFNSEYEIVKIINEFCEKKKLKLVILGRYIFPNDVLKEKNFFSNLIKNKFWYFHRFPKRDTYGILDKSKLVVSAGSTLGMESLGRKKKTAIIHIFPNKNPYKKMFWGYFTKRNNHGFFWNNGVNKKKIFQIFNRLLKIKKNQWEKKLRYFEYETTAYDYKNVKLKKKIIDFCLQLKFNIQPYLK